MRPVVCRSGFGALDPEVAMRQIRPGVALLLTATQSLGASMAFAAMRSAFDSSRAGLMRRHSPAAWQETTS
jgi:hypothetical protein